jgi:hypothetical protein
VGSYGLWLTVAISPRNLRRAPPNEGALLVIHDDRRLNASFLPVLVVIDLDHLDRAAIGKHDGVALADGLGVPAHDSNHTAGCVDEP